MFSPASDPFISASLFEETPPKAGWRGVMSSELSLICPPVHAHVTNWVLLKVPVLRGNFMMWKSIWCLSFPLVRPVFSLPWWKWHELSSHQTKWQVCCHIFTVIKRWRPQWLCFLTELLSAQVAIALANSSQSYVQCLLGSWSCLAHLADALGWNSDWCICSAAPFFWHVSAESPPSLSLYPFQLGCQKSETVELNHQGSSVFVFGEMSRTNIWWKQPKK